MLYSIDDKIQPTIGKADYWSSFRSFMGSDLHAQFQERISNILDEDTVNSLHSGSKIISDIESDSPKLLEKYSEEDIGPLYGMTLWNVIASIDTEWQFQRTKDESDEVNGTIYWKKR